MSLDYLYDYHIHTCFSSDSEETLENVAKQAVSKGLNEICITDHIDIGYPPTTDYPGTPFFFDVEKYFNEVSLIRENFRNQIYIKTGVELGLMPEYAREINAFLSHASNAGLCFDYIIASTHLIQGKDPYYPEFWDGLKPDDVIDNYFKYTYDNIRTFNDFNVYGHLDYITRYVPDKSFVFNYGLHRDSIDKILKLIIEKGRGIEVNYSNLNKGLTNPNPIPEILKRYRELGGEIITIGSDAHVAKNVGKHSGKMLQLLKKCGFDYITTFEKGKSTMRKIHCS